MPSPESPTSSQFVAGSDVNGYRRTIRTDENGDILTSTASGSTDTVDAADGSIGAAVPAIGIQVAGEDSSGNLKQLQLDGSGNLKVTGVGAANLSVSATGSAVPADATYIGANQSGNLVGLQLDGSGNLKVTGTAAVSYSKFHRVSLGSNNATSIKGSAGTFYEITISNNAAYMVFVKLYDKATSPNPASDTPARTFGVQAGVTVPFVMPSGGLSFSLGIGFAIVKGISDTDNTAVLAGDCVADLSYA